jgi:hypothetical protein
MSRLVPRISNGEIQVRLDGHIQHRDTDRPQVADIVMLPGADLQDHIVRIILRERIDESL